MTHAHNKTIFLQFISIYFLAIVFFLSGCQSQMQDMAQLEMTILKVGKADAIVLNFGSEAMVIDTGEAEDGTELLDYLASKGIDHIDVLLITHYDKDHVGGAGTVVRGTSVKRVLVPDYDGTSSFYQDFLAALQEKNITPERLAEETTFSIGDAEVTVEPALSSGDTVAALQKGKIKDNDLSLVTTVVHGDVRMVFAGDIESARIREWLVTSEEAVPCDFLKVPHHGGYDKELDSLFTRLKPRIAAICDSSKNPADEKTLALLAELGTEVLQTQNGDIYLFSDGSRMQASK